MTITPFWEQKTWKESEFRFTLPESTDMKKIVCLGELNNILFSGIDTDLRPRLANSAEPKEREIKRRILGGLIIGLELVKPTSNPRLALKRLLAERQETKTSTARTG